MPSLWKLFTNVHTGLYRLTGGRVGARMGDMRVLLLTTTGRKTGVARTTPLAFIEDDAGNLVITASAGGAPQNPKWFDNLSANPDVSYQLDGRVVQARAEVAQPAVRDALWAKLTSKHKNFLDYERKTTRVIPMVTLKPRA